ncbi:variant SH3 domain containing protein, putative [Entamoeba histolytica KU27]|uniref:Variant SH3 domain containing protein, putative n=1 Tax=Entamoeba histolytica KU27 TaxID=885311 RepID=M2Q4U5_ENTHI|nr:variant SH3 domain containing protein, putative [Entamoeba histolytica KU27]
MLPSHLGTGSNEIIKTLDTIRNSGSIEWVVYHVNFKNGDLIEDDTGTTVGDMVYTMDNAQVQFGYLRYEMDQTKKFLCVCWCGQAAPDNLKTKFVYYSRDWEDFLKSNNHSISVTISARKEEDLDESTIVDKLNKSTNSFVRARKQGEAKEDLNAKKNIFWQQQKTKDQQYNDEMNAKQKLREKEYAESKRIESEKLTAAAEARNAAMNAAKEQKVNAFKQQQLEKDEAEKARWKEQEQKHRQFVASHQQESEKPVAQQQVKGNVSAFASKFTQYAQKDQEEVPKVQPTGKKWTPKVAPAPEVPQPTYQRPTAPKPTYRPPQQTIPEPVQEQQQYQEEQQQYQEEQQQYQEEQQPEQQYQEEQQPEQQYQEEPVQEESQQYEETPQEEVSSVPPLPPKPRQQQGETYIAEYDYDATAEGDLTFREGDILQVISVDEDGWAQAINANGEQGTVPLNYLRKQ